MIGWAIFFLLAALCTLALWRVARPGMAALQIMLATMLVAAAGYAWQGHPALGGHPVTPEQARPKPIMAFAEERGDFMESVGPDADVLAAADTWIARGEPEYAIGILRGYLNAHPKTPMLWTGLGNALVQYADGSVTPAARYAFDKATALSKGSPAPAYFLGLDYALSGDFDSAMKQWEPILAAAPDTAPWRQKLMARVELLRRLRLSN